MYRLAKEEGMELGVFITKKFNKDTRMNHVSLSWVNPILTCTGCQML
jgi:hypothetical protein